jgi:hypothetical protein
MTTHQNLEPDSFNGLRVGVVYWGKYDGVASTLAQSLRDDLGCITTKMGFNEKLPHNLDAVLMYGPFDSMVPLGNQLAAIPASRRPKFIFWMTEQLPNPTLPEWIRYPVGLVRSKMERLFFRQIEPGVWRRPKWTLGWLAKGHRFRYYGDLYWLHRQGVLSSLAISSHWTADYLRTRGFSPHLMAGIPADWGADLGLERDIPVLWLGKIGSARRGRLLKRLRAELAACNVEIMVVDGVENPYIFGNDRTKLLNRTKIVLNLLREPWDDNSMRFCLAAPNRAMIITEPTLPHSSFKPGVHMVEAPVDQLAHTICRYLACDEERLPFVERAYHLAVQELPMGKGLARVLAPAFAVSRLLPGNNGCPAAAEPGEQFAW